MEFELFDAKRATDDEWHEIHAYRVLSMEHGWPELTPPTLEAMVARFRDGVSTDRTDVLWLAREHGEIVASAYYTVHHDDADHTVRIAFTTINVHPGRRRRGIGTAFLRLLLAEARRDGKDRISAAGVRSGTPEEAWTARLGFEPSRRVLFQRLVMGEADAALWDVPMPAGYRLVSWRAAVPGELLTPYSRFLAASWGSPNERFSPQAVRERATLAAADGCDSLVVAVVDEADGEIVATKAADIKHGAKVVAYPGPASGVLSHRDHRLDRVLEAAILRQLGAERPDVAEVAVDGLPYYLPEELAAYERRMQLIADLGYRLEEYLDVQAEVENLPQL